MRSGFTRELEERLRRADPTAGPHYEIRAITADDVKQTPEDWEAADSTTGFAILDEGIVRLEDGTDVLASHGSSNAFFEDLDEFRFGGDAINPHNWVKVLWSGTESAETELLRVTLRLHPRVNGAQSKEVVYWLLKSYAVAVVDQDPPDTVNGGTGNPALKLIPLADAIRVEANTEAEGPVTFDFGTFATRPKPIGILPRVFSSANFGITYSTFPQSLFRVTAHKADGSAADNTGLAYDSGTASTGGGPVLSSRNVTASLHPDWLEDVGSAGGTPRCSIEAGSYTSDDLEFTHPGNWFDLNREKGNEFPIPNELDDTTAWTTLNASINDQATTAPDGTSNADKIIEDGSAGNHGVFNIVPGISIDSGERVRLAWSIKAAERTKVKMQCLNGGTGFWIEVNLSTGATIATGDDGDGVLLSSEVVLVDTGGGSWYYVAIEGTLGTRIRAFGEILLLDAAGASSYTGDGTSGLYAWRATLVRDPVAVPAAADTVLSISGAVPNGTALTGKIRNDANSAFVTFTDSQTFADLSLTPTVVRKVRVEFDTNAATSLTPSLTLLALEVIDTIDLTHVAEVESYSSSVDPIECKAEITEIRLRAVKDGELDYRSTIEDILANFFLRDLTLRVLIGDDDLDRSLWMLHGDYLVTDFKPSAAEVTIIGLSPLLLVRNLLPPYSPGESLKPADEISNPDGWTNDDTTTTTMETRIQFEDQTTYVQSALAPTNDTISFRLEAPQGDTTGRRHIVEYEYRKDTASGMTIDLTFAWKQGATVVASAVVSGIGAEWQRGSFELTDDEIAQLSDSTDWRLDITANNTGGTPNRRGQVSWAQFRLGGRREAVEYNDTRQAVFEDLVRNRLEVPARYWGPGVIDTTTTIAKELFPQSARLFERENLTSKTDVDAVCFLGGEVLTSSQGRLKVVDLFDKTKAVVAQFHPTEIEMLDTSPGFDSAIPEYFFKYDWSESRGGFESEVRAISGALENLPLGRLDGPREPDDEVAKWVNTEDLATTVAERIVTHFGPGYISWEFQSSVPYPELEEGDLVSIPVEQFVARDPVTGASLRGLLSVLAVISACRDPMGTQFGCWIRSYSAFQGVGEEATNSPATPQSALPQRAKVYIFSAALTIPNATPTVVIWGTQEYNDGGLIEDAGATGLRFRIPAGRGAGQWTLTTHIYWSPNAVGTRSIEIHQNGSVISSTVAPSAGATDPTIQECTAVLNQPSAGDYFEVVVTQTSTGDLTIVGAAGWKSWFSIAQR